MSVLCAVGDYHHCCFYQAHGWKKLVDVHEGVIKRLSLSIHYKGSGPDVGSDGQYDEVIYHFAEEQDVWIKAGKVLLSL